MAKQLLMAMVGASLALSATAAELDLAGVWELRTPSATNVWACAIPGDNASALLEAGAIRDPFWKGQEDCVQWIGDVDWIFSRTFDAPAKTGDLDNAWLEFDSIDTVADVSLNGTSLGHVENEFRKWRFDVTKILKPTGNRLEVRIAAPRKAAEERWLRTPDYDIRSWGCTTCRAINALRKCQCSFGWDWGCSLPVSGLYYGVRLVTGRQRLCEAWAEATLNADGSADVVIHTGVSAVSSIGGTCTFNGEAKQFVGDTVTFRLAKPELWWPNGMGKQKLYDWSVSFDGQTAKGRLGIRKLELVTTPDVQTTNCQLPTTNSCSFGFRVNGRDFFALGADWIPCDAFPSRRTPERMRNLLQSAADAHMNTVRVWGGGVYESEAFYDLCDELGLLVWQDFMFACARYPARQDFLDNVAAEAEYQVQRLRKHASILLWCGDNECIGGVREPGAYQDDWKAWNGVLAAAVKKHAPNTIWWPSSPCAGVGRFEYNELMGDSGDTHYWGVWHGSRDLSGYYQLAPRFCSEFGYQSFPSPAMVARSGGRIHQKNPGGNEKIDRMMAKYFPPPKDEGERIYLSQVQQALAIETAVAYWRSLWPHCRGAVVWQLNDWWPVASWSSIEYDGRWKPLHYAMRRFFAPGYDAKGRAAALRHIDFRDCRVATTNDVRIAGVLSLGDGNYEVVVKSAAPAKFVYVEDPGDPNTRFDDNLVDMVAGSRSFKCRAKGLTAQEEEAFLKRLTVRALIAPNYDVSLESLLAEMTDRNGIAYLDKIPWTGKLWSSYDRRSVKDDGEAEGWYANHDWSHWLRKEKVGAREECVMVDAKGPGAVTRMWTANGGDTVLRIYVDGEREPRWTGHSTNLTFGVVVPHPLQHAISPLVEPRFRAYNLYLPIPYAKALKITAELPKSEHRFWYNIETRTYADGVAVESMSDAVLWRNEKAVARTAQTLTHGTDEDLKEWRFGERTLAPQGVAELNIGATGSAVKVIDLCADVPLADLDLVIGFDDRAAATVRADQLLAGGAIGATAVMPFKSSCRVGLTNRGAKPVDLSKAVVKTGRYDWDDKRSLYFGAYGFVRKDLPTRKGKAGYYEINWATLQGEGKLLGNALILDNKADYKKAAWWGEGDEKIYVDGEAFPSYFGTGTEDFFGYAWGPNKAYDASPFLRMPMADGEPDAQGRHRAEMWRMRRLDTVPFAKSLRLDVEVWHWQDTKMDFAPATFWYARPGAQLK